MARLNVSLGEEQKQRWKESVDELPEVNNTSDLVRTAVELYMADELDRGTESEGANLNDAVTDLDNSLDRIEGQISDVKAHAQAAHVEQISDEELEAIVYEQSLRAVEEIVAADLLPVLQQMGGRDGPNRRMK